MFSFFYTLLSISSDFPQTFALFLGENIKQTCLVYYYQSIKEADTDPGLLAYVTISFRIGSISRHFLSHHLFLICLLLNIKMFIKGQPQPVTTAQLQPALIQECRAISQQQIRTLVQSMHRWETACIILSGGYTSNETSSVNVLKC